MYCTYLARPPSLFKPFCFDGELWMTTISNPLDAYLGPSFCHVSRTLILPTVELALFAFCLKGLDSIVVVMHFKLAPFSLEFTNHFFEVITQTSRYQLPGWTQLPPLSMYPTHKFVRYDRFRPRKNQAGRKGVEMLNRQIGELAREKAILDRKRESSDRAASLTYDLTKVIVAISCCFHTMH